MRAKKFQMFDEGPAFKVSTGHLPPTYPLNQIQTPLILFEGTQDSLQDSSLKRLPSLAARHEIEGYEHLDFMWAESLSLQVWPLIINHLNRLRVNKSKTKNSMTERKPISPPPDSISKEDFMEAFKEFLDERNFKKSIY